MQCRYTQNHPLKKLYPEISSEDDFYKVVALRRFIYDFNGDVWQLADQAVKTIDKLEEVACATAQNYDFNALKKESDDVIDGLYEKIKNLIPYAGKELSNIMNSFAGRFFNTTKWNAKHSFSCKALVQYGSI